MKVEIIRKEIIKPCSSKSDHLSIIPLPISAHLIPPIYIASVFFFDVTEEEIISTRLKQSLSETLTHFYPLAGRIHGVFINCNDEGAIFSEARTDCFLFDFLKNPDLDSIDQLLPSDFTSSLDPFEKWPLLNVKVSFFRSGGIAVCVCVSHKVCDAASLAIFIRGWTATAKGYADTVRPEFDATTFFPAPDDSCFDSSISDERFDKGRLFLKKRFVFEAFKIAELKNKAASMNVPNPTRVEAISALILRCVRKASDRTKLRPLVMTQAMDLRRRVPSTHLPHNTIGNLAFAFLLKYDAESEIDIQESVTKSRKAKDEVNEMIKENLEGNRKVVTLGEKMVKVMMNYATELTGELDVYNVTSWSQMGFYEADFGWGNPLWVAPGTVNTNDNGVILMDAKDGEGIEAFVSLLEQDMFMFERDQELLGFATPNLSVFN